MNQEAPENDIPNRTKLNVFGSSQSRYLLVLRGFIGCISLIALYFSIKFIDPADSTALYTTNVIMVTFMARFVLKEKLNLTHIMATILIIIGNTFIFRYM